eukprot:TRINITY_DN7790_c0_g1_i1.p1 TRINITY_DN7790_c0_g1~~TRINITY_DN7790_c0_g1_i1.p1  ORF type:complete len:497 (-),score=62.48 TRINITY_DN7790_c0_g1_i1:44-1534(-)
MRSRLRRSVSSLSGDGNFRPVCKHGVKCYRRNPDHLKQEAHPADVDYLSCCRAQNLEPEFVSIRKMFEWVDEDAHGKATRENLAKVWPLIQSYGEGVPDLTDDLWNTLDDDGNGHINFSEFAEFTTLKKVDLPLGLDDLFGETNSAGASLRCGVLNCDCENFVMRRARCKYGADCYQKAEEHRARFCHPGDDEWDKREGPGGSEMCRCGHKKKLHASSASGAAAVPYPDYWTCSYGKGSSSSASGAAGDATGEFLEMVPVDDETMAKLQALVDSTYSDVTTRDRQRHSGSWMVPRDFTVHEAWRVENSKLWRKYCVRKAILADERRILCESLDETPYEVRRDVKTMDWAAQDRCNHEINEWYLWHGTSGSAAQNICRTDFKMCLAGSATGTLYGRGAYLAESITKADEYSKAEEGFNTVLLCRVLGGNVRYCDERTPDPDELTRDCVEGDYDLIIGDRIKTSGTYREFIVFDTENVYPEYIVKYKRGEVFKFPSHP